MPVSDAPSSAAFFLMSSFSSCGSVIVDFSGETGPSRIGVRLSQCAIMASRAGNFRCQSGTSSMLRSRSEAQSSASCIPCSRIQLFPIIPNLLLRLRQAKVRTIWEIDTIEIGNGYYSSFPCRRGSQPSLHRAWRGELFPESRALGQGAERYYLVGGAADDTGCGIATCLQVRLDRLYGIGQHVKPVGPDGA